MERKNLILVSAIIVVGIIAVVLHQIYKSYVDSTAEAIGLGKTYGEMVSQADCITGLTLKYATCSRYRCGLAANGFINGCMETAKTDSFCEKVPYAEDSPESRLWIETACSDNNMDAEMCPKFMQAFITACQ